MVAGVGIAGGGHAVHAAAEDRGSGTTKLLQDINLELRELKAAVRRIDEQRSAGTATDEETVARQMEASGWRVGGPAAATGVVRIACIGDSLTSGFDPEVGEPQKAGMPALLAAIVARQREDGLEGAWLSRTDGWQREDGLEGTMADGIEAAWAVAARAAPSWAAYVAGFETPHVKHDASIALRLEPTKRR